MSESIRTFHQALNSLEQDIVTSLPFLAMDTLLTFSQVSAKAVFQRDLNQIHDKGGQISTPQTDALQPTAPLAQMTQTPMPQPVEAQTKSPMVIDLDSSPPADGSPTLIKSEPGASAPVAVMNGASNGVSNSSATQGVPPIVTPVPPPMVPPHARAPPAVMEQDGAAGATAVMDTDSGSTSNTNGGAAMNGSNNELNFTNMTFAPPNEEAPMSTQDQSFDMSNFASGDGGNGMMALENNMLQDNNAQGNTNSSNTAGQGQDTSGTANGGDNGGGSLDDFDWSLNEGTGDGLDFDFSIGGEDTFNTLMNERDGDFGSMDQSGFDTDPFNMGNSNGT
jgi:hypothetical protein